MSERHDEDLPVGTDGAEGGDVGAAGPGALHSELTAELDELRDRHLRLAAEYDNYRKRTAKEWKEHQARSIAEVLREVLELADNLQRALDAPQDDAAGLRRGVELIAQQLQAKLRRFGVEPMEVRGREFDPTQHEAVLAVDSDSLPSHSVVDEVQRGYLLNGEVLRPARVTVAR
jgi:molecular chaperone GrpE